ncbi:MAG: hypothetical protein LBV60_12275, partial [Streptomyces sp.]|nr:hypothetical protein [Streptomyces sp.]
MGGSTHGGEGAWTLRKVVGFLRADALEPAERTALDQAAMRRNWADTRWVATVPAERPPLREPAVGRTSPLGPVSTVGDVRGQYSWAALSGSSDRLPGAVRCGAVRRRPARGGSRLWGVPVVHPTRDPDVVPSEAWTTARRSASS